VATFCCGATFLPGKVRNAKISFLFYDLPIFLLEWVMGLWPAGQINKLSHRSLRASSGNALLVVIVLLGVVAALSSTLTDMFNANQQNQSRLRNSTDFKALQRYLARSISCPTLNEYSCNGFIEVRRKSSDSLGPILISNYDPGHKLGSLTLRAECDLSNSRLIVRAARLRPSGSLSSTSSGDFYPDPLTGQVITWADDASLIFDSSTTPCNTPEGAASRVVCSPPVTTRDKLTEWGMCPPGERTLQLFCMSRYLQWTDVPSDWDDAWWRISDSHTGQVGNISEPEANRIRCWCGGTTVSLCHVKACARCI